MKNLRHSRRATLLSSTLGALALGLVGIGVVTPAAHAETPQTTAKISVTASANTPSFVAGDVITYKVTVKNTGTETLRGATISLPAEVTLDTCSTATTVSTSQYTKQTSANSQTPLQPGATFTCTATHVATSLEARAGQILLPFDGASNTLPGSETKTPLPARWYVITPEASLLD